MGNQESFGDSDCEANDAALEAVAALIHKLQEGSMVQRFVLVVETIDEENKWFSAFTAPGQKRWDSLGLLAYATAIESNTHIDNSDDE